MTSMLRRINNTREYVRKPRHKISVRFMIFSAFVVFSLVVLSLLWLSQTVFMDDLYKHVRMSEIKKCADKLAASEDDDYENVAEELSNKYDICITVYKIEDGIGKPIVNAHVDGGCFIHNLISEGVKNDSLLTRLYNEAVNAGDDGYAENVSVPEARSDDSFVGDILYSRVVSLGKCDYMLLFNTEIYPLDSTVSSMRMMLIYISIALIITAAGVSLVLSEYLTSSVRKMSAEAGRLALGDYSVSFDGGAVRELSELSDALNHAAQELSGLDKLQKDLIANVSHDLRTPLTLISGYSEVMRDIPGEMTAENMQLIIDESARLTSLVNDMLDMSRFISGHYVFNMIPFDITSAVRETVERYSRMCSRDGYRIDFEFDSEATVIGDRASVLRVIYNLLTNAIHYTGDDHCVVIRQIVSDGICRIEISDSGQGIPENELPLIWDRYYRSGEFHKRSVAGSGLGLSIVKSILASHKARFGVRSLVGHGSTFWFELPVVNDEKQ